MSIKKFLVNMITAGKDVNEDIEALRRTLILNAMMIPGMFFTMVLGIIAFSNENSLLGLADTVIFITQLGLIMASRKAENLDTPITVASVILLVFFVFLAVEGGIANTAIVWTLLYPPVAISLLGNRKGIPYSAVLLLAMILIFVLQESSLIKGEYSLAFQVRLIAVYVTIALVSMIGEELRSRVHERMKESNRAKEKAIEELNQSIKEIKTLQGILPICLHCKKIRDDDGYWQAVDQYIHSKTDARFSHALCPDCLKEHYSEYADEAADSPGKP